MLTDIFSGHALPGEYVFVLLCAAAAWMIGKSVAGIWKGIPELIGYVLLLGVGTRFLHFALYEAAFVSIGHYVADTILFLIVAFIGYRYTRTNQMTEQYNWLYEKASPITWRDKN